MSASYLSIHIYINIEFPIVNVLFICYYIPAAPTYGVYISQLIRYYRAYGSHHDALARGFFLQMQTEDY